MKSNRAWIGKRAKKYKGRQFNSMAHNMRSRKLILHNEGVDRGGQGDPVGLMKYVVDRGIEYHLTWNVQTGEWCQSTPLGSASKAMLNAGTWGGIGDNRAGDVCIQLCVVGYGYKPFTDSPLKGAGLLADICDSWNIPMKALGDFKHPSRSIQAFSGNGISGHQFAPGNDHQDPGPIDFDKLVKVARKQQKGK